MTQKEMVLDFMKREGSITPWEAIKEFGITRLGARIWELKNEDGIRIKSETVVEKNRYGKPVNFAQYSLVQYQRTHLRGTHIYGRTCL